MNKSRWIISLLCQFSRADLGHEVYCKVVCESCLRLKYSVELFYRDALGLVILLIIFMDYDTSLVGWVYGWW